MMTMMSNPTARRIAIVYLRNFAMQMLDEKRALPRWAILRRWECLRAYERFHHLANELMFEDNEEFLDNAAKETAAAVLRGIMRAYEDMGRK